MNQITIFNYQALNKEEIELKSLLFCKKNQKEFSPKKTTVAALLNYSKSLSIRKSKYMNVFEMVLN